MNSKETLSQGALPKVQSSQEWLAYFRVNRATCRPILWEKGMDTTMAEVQVIARSLQAWQLGETSDGNHLRAAAAKYAKNTNDPTYADVIDLFIKEEQYHGNLLGRFLDLAGIDRLQKDWGDSLFRRARYWLTNMEVWTTPVVMVETLAMIYYNAIRRATKSSVLQAICCQILADEVPHIRFQCQRLAIMHRHRRPWLYQLTMLGHRLFFAFVVYLVWLGHGRALKAGGYTWRHYRTSAWNRMNHAWKLMNPRRYWWG